jgi:hypothetical protein
MESIAITKIYNLYVQFPEIICNFFLNQRKSSKSTLGIKNFARKRKGYSDIVVSIQNFTFVAKIIAINYH